MTCKDCSKWQGNKYSKWGDCNHVIGVLCPGLLDQYTTNEYGTMDKVFTLPFDPHDIKYWKWHGEWKNLYYDLVLNTMTIEGNPGYYWFDWYNDQVRIVENTREDVIYDYNRGERIDMVKYYYLQTRKEYTCEYSDGG